jgi:hypothetical protein
MLPKVPQAYKISLCEKRLIFGAVDYDLKNISIQTKRVNNPSFLIAGSRRTTLIAISASVSLNDRMAIVAI